MRRLLRCKGEEDKGRHEDGLRIDLRGDVIINGVEGVAPDGSVSNCPYSQSLGTHEVAPATPEIAAFFPTI